MRIPFFSFSSGVMGIKIINLTIQSLIDIIAERRRWNLYGRKCQMVNCGDDIWIQILLLQF